MFIVHHDGTAIGNSALEIGDPPMGGAEGLLVPNADFGAFRAAVSVEEDVDPAIKRWIGLKVTTDAGVMVECVDVVLFEYDFDDQKELVVTVFGIRSPSYEELFPGRYAAYLESFS